MSVIANLDINLRGNTQGIEKAANTTSKKLVQTGQKVNQFAAAIEARFQGMSHKIGGAMSAIPGGHIVSGVLAPLVGFAGKIGTAFTSAVPGIASATTAMGTFGTVTAAATGGLSLVLAGLGSMAAATGAAGLAWVGLGMHAMDGIDKLKKSADMLDIDVDALAGLQHAAKLAGVDNESFTNTLAKMEKGFAKVADGAKESAGATAKAIGASEHGKLAGSSSALHASMDAAAKHGEKGGEKVDRAAAAYEKLGASIDELRKLKPDELFLKQLEAVKNAADQTERAGLATQFWSKEGMRLIPLAMQGPEAIKKAMQEAADIGLSVTQRQAEEVEQANDAWETMKSAFTGFARTAAITIAPFVKMFADGITEAMKWVNSFRETLVDWSNTALFVFKNFNSYVNLYFDMALLKVVSWANDFTNIFTNVIPTAIGEFINLIKPGLTHIQDNVAYAMVRVANTVVHTFTEVLPAVLSQWQDIMKAAMSGDIDAMGRLLDTVKSKMSRQEGDVERILREDAERSGQAFGRAFEQSMSKVRQSFQREKGGIEAAMEASVNMQQRMLDNQLQQFLKDRKAALNPKKKGESETEATGTEHNGAVERGSQEAFKIIANAQGDKMLKAANDQLREIQKTNKLLDKLLGKPSGIAIGRGVL